jgi:hypothetical protein
MGHLYSIFIIINIKEKGRDPSEDRCRREGNIKVYLKEIGFGPMANCFEHVDKSSGSIKVGEFLEKLSTC